MRLMRGGQSKAGGTRGAAHRAAHRAALGEDGSLRLALDDREERLPWLQGEEGEGDEQADGVDSGRIVAFTLALLVVLAVLAGVGWWLWQGGMAAPEADGSIIAAPQGPYKMRAADTGGNEVAGTGATSFEVGEGLNLPGRIADEPAPVAAAAGESEAAGAEVAGGVGVQIGAYPTREAAQAGWQQLHARLEPLHGRSHRIVEGTSDSAPVFRLQVVAPGMAAAQDLCRSLRTVGGDCQVKP